MNLRIVMCVEIEFSLSFEGSIYGLSKLQRYFLEKAASLTDGESTICIRAIENGEVAGSIKFCTTYGKEEEKSQSIWARLWEAMLLKGFIFEQSKKPCLTWITREGEWQQRISAKYTIMSPRPKPVQLHKDDMLDTDILLKELQTDNDLVIMACEMKKNEKLSKDIGNFIWYWMEFNRTYGVLSTSEREGIKCYVKRLSNYSIDILFDRNRNLFAALSTKQLKLCSRSGCIFVSTELHHAINNHSKKDAVMWAALCVYALRNKLFHTNRLSFQDIVGVTCFIRDLIHVQLIVKYKKSKNIDIGLCSN